MTRRRRRPKANAPRVRQTPRARACAWPGEGRAPRAARGATLRRLAAALSTVEGRQRAAAKVLVGELARANGELRRVWRRLAAAFDRYGAAAEKQYERLGGLVERLGELNCGDRETKRGARRREKVRRALDGAEGLRDRIDQAGMEPPGELIDEGREVGDGLELFSVPEALAELARSKRGKKRT